MNAKLFTAVKRQLHGTKQEKVETLRDVARGGADAGFGGFCYYSETTSFYRKHKTLIVELVEDMANDFGENPIEMVFRFRCLNQEFTQAEVAKVLYGPWKDDDAHTMVGNALAWFALEAVAREFDN